MIQSGKPRYQRFFRFNAPMHARQHFMHAHIDKALRSKLKIKARAIQVVKGDTVKIMVGKKAGTSGKVVSSNLKTGKITIENVVRKNARGKEAQIPISVSNVYITDLNLTDKYRAAKLKLTPVPKQEQKPQPPKPVAAEQKPAEEKHEHAPAQTSAARVAELKSGK